MTWFKLDDKFAFHSKVMAAGNEAVGMWCRAGSWSSGELLDGFVPEHMALAMGPRKLWVKLETCGGPNRAGLAEKVDGGWQIHDFADWNPSSADVEKARADLAEKRRRAGIAGNDKRWAERRKAVASATRKPVANESQEPRTCEDHDLAPVPTRPDPKGSDPPVVPPTGDPRKPKRARSVLTLIPPNWSPSESHFELAANEGGRDRSWVDHEAAKMRDWAESRGRRYADWDAMFRNWLRRSMQDHPASQGATPPPPTRQPAYPQHRPLEVPARMTQSELKASAEASKQAKLQLDALMGEMPNG